MLKILIYTFFSYSKKTSKGLYELELSEVDKLFIPNRFATNKLISLIPEYNYVIGIADHKKNALRSRFDPRYVNKYSKKELINDNPMYLDSNLNIDLSDNFYEFNSTTNGPCNRSSYFIMNEIIDRELKTIFGFFHLRKENCMEDLKEIIDKIK